MLTAKDIMTKDVITVQPETTVEELAALLCEHRISGAPVLDGKGKLYGVVTESDLLDQKKKFHIPTMISLLDSVIFLDSEKKIEQEIKRMTGSRVQDICRTPPVSVTEDTTVDEIATIMAEKKMHTLPVLRGETLVGVIGKSDVIRTIAKE